MTAYELGFGSLDDERRDVDLPVEGEVPAWLSGALIRNGPGTFEAGDGTVDHWFDGLAMLRRFAFRDGGVRYTNRFLRTDAYRRAERGDLPSGFATGGSLLSRLKSLVLGGPYDNANVIAERIGGRYLALTETPRWVAFDPESLATLGDVRYDGPAPRGHLACAHLHRDPRTGTVVNFEVEFGRTSRYHVYGMTAPTEREPIASVPVREPAYMHSFALAGRYVVLTEFPFVVDPLDFLRPGAGAFVDAFRWEPDRGTRFVVIDRRAGEVIAEPATDAFFAFHHVNAFERDGDLVLDVETVPEAPESVAALSLSGLRAGDLDVPAGTIERFRIADPAGDAAVEREVRYAGGTALPTVSPAVRCREHRYVYAQGVDRPATDWPGAIARIDVRDGSALEYEPRGYPSEPVFVPRPGGDAADDGVVLSVVLDPDVRQSHLVVLDGRTMEERARATLPHALPFDFHGRFFPATDAITTSDRR